MSYWASVQESTGCTPNLFMHRETNLAIDLMVGMPWQMCRQYSCEIEYVEWIRNTVRASYSYARRKLKTAAYRQKKNWYDQRAKPHLSEVGKFVWRWYVPAAIGKLSCGWTGPWKIVAKSSDVNCEIQKTPDGTRVLVHIDALKPYWG